MEMPIPAIALEKIAANYRGTVLCLRSRTFFSIKTKKRTTQSKKQQQKKGGTRNESLLKNNKI